MNMRIHPSTDNSVGGRRALFTSPLQPIPGCSPNVYSWDKSPGSLRLSISFLNHPGLAFIAANSSCEILEYPDEAAFESALENPPDILGISFYINETNIAKRMAERARARGVKEIWGGNFGAYSEGLEGIFDRTFTGWSEHEVRSALGEPPVVGPIKHPELYGAMGSWYWPKMILSGMLFTSRGCPYTCNFCQTPSFYGKSKTVPLETIEEVLWNYKRRGVRGINILDENFGTFRGHSSEVADLLKKFDMRWIALTRVDTLQKNFDEWESKGLFGAHLGVESLNDASLAGASKRITESDTGKLLARMRSSHMFVQAFYIIGFPEDTPESIRRDIEQLSKLDLDVVQVQVLTPYPKTENYDRIKAEFGITDTDLSHYNSRNLVWDHPNISPPQMRELQEWANSKLQSTRRSAKTIAKFVLYCGRRGLNFDGLRLVGSPIAGKARGLHATLSSKVQSARRWAKRGWYAYET
jgi:hypothetical protein